MPLRDLKWFTPATQKVQAEHRARVAALHEGTGRARLVAITGPMFGRCHGLGGNNDIDMLKDPDAWLDDVLSDMARQATLLANRRTFCPPAIELDALGTHYLDAIFGANVFFKEGQVWSEPLDCELTALAPPDLAGNRVFQASLELARRAVRAAQDKLLVTTPVLSCPINIGINLFGERLLAAFIERPAAVSHALRVITALILACCRSFQEIIPVATRRTTVACNRYAPPAHGFIDGCATQLISARHYREFVAPLDNEILSAKGQRGGMIHLCGSCVQHIPAWRDMEPLRSVQLNDRATDDLEHYARGLRPDQVLYVSPTEATPVPRILSLTRGRRIVLQCPMPESW